MQQAYVVRGRVSDATHIELDEPVAELGCEVQVLILGPAKAKPGKNMNVFDFIRTLKPGTRTKADIDQQVRDERDQWGD